TKFETSQKHHAHHGVAAQQIQPITYIIGINKLGTLLSSQTTDTFEYSRNNSERISFPYFFAAMFLSYFIHIRFCKSGCFPGIHSTE
ncbi:MAG TPA: hypothetical protein VJQ80_08045, partial [Arthrobacter sp.]|nr:hypothetical protein [Arthrobacter sp.]